MSFRRHKCKYRTKVIVTEKIPRRLFSSRINCASFKASPSTGITDLFLDPSKALLSKSRSFERKKKHRFLRLANVLSVIDLQSHRAVPNSGPVFSFTEEPPRGEVWCKVHSLDPVCLAKDMFPPARPEWVAFSGSRCLCVPRLAWVHFTRSHSQAVISHARGGKQLFTVPEHGHIQKHAETWPVINFQMTNEVNIVIAD